MKSVLIFLAIAAIIVCTAGCTSPSSPPASSLPGAQNALPMNGSTVLGTGSHTTLVSLNSFEVTPPGPDGNQTITIYVAAKNTGNDSVRYIWFSKITDINGKTYGGIGVSHGGHGARTAAIQPNNTEAARDYVMTDSAQDLATINKGALLDVYFMEQKDNVTQAQVPDYHVTWKLDPDSIPGELPGSF